MTKGNSDMRISNRSQVIRKISACDVVLFGAGYRAHQFYNSYKNVLNIIFCISNNVKERKCSFDDGRQLKVEKPSEVLANKTKNIFFIICADAYLEIESQLISYGMIAGEDYIHYELFNLLMTDKKIAVLYGVCYMRPICQCLKKSSDFYKEYEAFYWLSYKTITSAEHMLLLCLLRVCDLYVYNPSISRQERVVAEGYLSILPENCVRVTLPSVGAEAYHPQAIRTENQGNIYSIVPAESAYGPFTCQDWYINQMIDNGTKLAEVKKAVKDEGFLRPDWVKENYETQIRKIELQECISDIKICDYLTYYHKKKRLFLDGSHISNEPICEVANRLLEKLGYTPLSYVDEADTMLIYASEIPVYPSVIKGLQLSVYENDEPMYRLFTFQGYQRVTFDEYIEQYYDYCVHMKRYIERGYVL